MLKLLILYAHLLATCIALGTIVLTDLRLFAMVFGYRTIIRAPSRFETSMVSVALVLLYLTGGALIVIGLAESPDYLNNEKLLSKLFLVLVLTLNAFVLHFAVFPHLERKQRVAKWKPRQYWTVAISVGLSNSLWLYCAFLGIARPWNYVKPAEEVLILALLLWAVSIALVQLMLTFAGRDKPSKHPDWIDSMKARFVGRPVELSES